jgi:hypothetical protein
MRLFMFRISNPFRVAAGTTRAGPCDRLFPVKVATGSTGKTAVCRRWDWSR